MLESLSVKNVALIESIEIEFGSSLNVLTGETGAGKSILLDSIGLLLGDRIDKNLLRSGADDCKVSGKFSLDNQFCKSFFMAFCEKYDLEYDDEIIVSRIYTKDGKSSIKINGQVATLSMLRELSSALVNSYGQNENQTIFDVNSHLQILDNFSNISNFADFAEYCKQFANLKEIEKKLNEFGGSNEERLREIDILQYQIDEIENFNPSVEDYAELENKRQILLNIGKIVSNTSIAQNLFESDVLPNLYKINTSLLQASNYDNKIADLQSRVQSTRFEIEDIAETLKEYNGNYDFSEKEQDEIENRFSKYQSLFRKFGGNIESLLAEFIELKNKLYELKNADEKIEKLNNEKIIVLKELSILSKSISDFRKINAEKLGALIENNLKNLNMKNAKLYFNFEKTDKYLSNGQDVVEILFSSNLGESVKPLNKIASGGEISRFMLALKSVIAKTDNMPTMIFDEIDTGISGATSEAVAKQMAIISKNHQVICVTHSQQIASMADTNFLIEKFEQNDRTITNVKRLNYEEKVKEVARFMSGEHTNEISLQNARQLIAEQEDYKKSIENIDN